MIDSVWTKDRDHITELIGRQHYLQIDDKILMNNMQNGLALANQPACESLLVLDPGRGVDGEVAAAVHALPAVNPSLIQNTVLLLLQLRVADRHHVEEYAPIRPYKRRRQMRAAAAAADDGPVDKDRGVSGGEARGQGAWRAGSVEERQRWGGGGIGAAASKSGGVRYCSAAGELNESVVWGTIVFEAKTERKRGRKEKSEEEKNYQSYRATRRSLPPARSSSWCPYALPPSAPRVFATHLYAAHNLPGTSRCTRRTPHAPTVTRSKVATLLRLLSFSFAVAGFAALQLLLHSCYISLYAFAPSHIPAAARDPYAAVCHRPRSGLLKTGGAWVETAGASAASGSGVFSANAEPELAFRHVVAPSSFRSAITYDDVITLPTHVPRTPFSLQSDETSAGYSIFNIRLLASAIGSAFERVRTRSAQKPPGLNAELNYAFRFGQSPNREPELGVQFSLVQVRTEIRTELARHYAFESDRGRAATRDGWGESSYLKGSRNSFDRQRKGGTPEILGCHVVGRAAFGDAAVELARKLRKASPVFSWDTARAPGPEEMDGTRAAAAGVDGPEGVRLGTVPPRRAREAAAHVPGLRECALHAMLLLSVGAMSLNAARRKSFRIELTSKHIRAFTARWGLELGRFYLKLVNGSCRLAIEVQVVSSGWRPAERAPQHALKRRKQRATRASLQTLAAPHAVPPRVTCNHPARRQHRSRFSRRPPLTLRNVQYREMQYRRALFMLNSGHIPYFTKRPLPLDPPPSSMSSRDYLVSAVTPAVHFVRPIRADPRVRKKRSTTPPPWAKFVVRPWVCYCMIMTALTQKECPSFKSPLFELILVPGSWDLPRLGVFAPPPPLHL
ncbi:hypothetical protein GGX14DRAFT_401433 [Mycena pura]|uniref:Uncharacterized protein n=1 Tax=Mycena pura TaxID=153505 RepID=A0AAD6V149_9AGAR|nr:hypothetical protein GGX14DRAFT_401433 [Mycena pura]